METNLGSHIRVSLGDLKDEVNQIRKTHSKLKDDAAFVLWFIEAWICDAGVDPAGSLTGESGDKNADAIYEDEKAHQVHIVQGKFRQSVDHSEKRNDVLSFVDLALFPWKSKDAQNQFYLDLPPLVKEKFEGLVKRVRIDKWSLKMHYVTTGRCSAGIIGEAQSRIKDAEGSVEFTFYDSKMVLTILKDYLEGVAPGVPVLGLRIASVGPITTQGNIYRLDPRSKIESYVFTMAVEDVADLYAKVGIRLFARNIRGYLGSTEVNDAIADTAKHEPENFWYYNNGVTIVCDDIRKEDLVGKSTLYVTKPQIINGQQTTRTLQKIEAKAGSLLVKVIKIPRNPGDDESYDSLVNSIVRATNFQNHIEPSDLVSNDYVQVSIERAMRKVGYQYIRKRMKKSEAWRLFRSLDYWQIDKRELAQAVAATLFDPVVVRKGKEGLFENPYYKSIFSSRSVGYYLSRYWLMSAVQYSARGKPDRAYGKWLVLNFAWELLSSSISSGEGERKFRNLVEIEPWNSKALHFLIQGINGIYLSVMKYYRTNRGTGAEAKDISSFFLLAGHHEKFRSFWVGSLNNQKTRVNISFNKFRQHLSSYEIQV